MMSEPAVIVWVHGDCLRPDNPALLAHPNAPALFVFDDALIAESGIGLKRLVFLYECLLELPVMIRRGDVAVELAAFAAAHSARKIVTTDSPAPRFAAVCKALRKTLPVEVLDEPPFLDYEGSLDLGRFSRYWRVAQRYVMEG